jgi:hypothetical protein
VNDLFIGPKTHSSARYVIRIGPASETQSSSGVIVSTGMGSTGWLKSLLTGATALAESSGAVLSRRTKQAGMNARVWPGHEYAKGRGRINAEFAWDSDYLFFTVREPFPTKTTGASLVFGRVTAQTPLVVESRMPENGVIFSDGIESDFLNFNSGTLATIGIAPQRGRLVE